MFTKYVSKINKTNTRLGQPKEGEQSPTVSWGPGSHLLTLDTALPTSYSMLGWKWLQLVAYSPHHRTRAQVLHNSNEWLTDRTRH